LDGSRGQIDLHIHTGYSEGAFGSPHDAVRKAAQLGLRAVALTEHDNIDSLPEAREAAKRYGVELVPGVEVTTHYRHRALSYHLLGYYFDPEDESLLKLIKRIREAQQHNLARVISTLGGKGSAVSWEALEACTAQLYPDIPGRLPDWYVLERLLVDAGAAENREEASDMRLAALKEAGKIRGYPEQERVFDTIKQAGGLVIMAHPEGFIRDHATPKKLLGDLLAEGLDGVEAYTPKHDGETRRFYGDLAEELDCVVTGGSDCHDVTRPARRCALGRARVPYRVLRRMRRRLRMKFGKWR
jgi:predicted metal-dependent phosphoesterase TrpH